MKTKQFIAWRLSGFGYPYAVEMLAGDIVEIHGPFFNYPEAKTYGVELKATTKDYTSYKVVKLETPAVSA